MMVGLRVPRIEMDELWAFVGKKQRRVTKEDGFGVGDQYTFIAMASSAKAIIAYHTGSVNGISTTTFVDDLSERVLGRPEISSDGFHPTAQRSLPRSAIAWISARSSRRWP